jgi:hypothetical protein
LISVIFPSRAASASSRALTSVARLAAASEAPWFKASTFVSISVLS